MSRADWLGLGLGLGLGGLKNAVRMKVRWLGMGPRMVRVRSRVRK